MASGSSSNNQKKAGKLTMEELHKQLHQAVNVGNLSEMKKLITEGAKPCGGKSYLFETQSCYIMAQFNSTKNPEFLTCLLECGGNIEDCSDFQGTSLLMKDIALGCKHFQQLIDKGANVNHSNEQGYTALHYAAVEPKAPIDVIKKLIELGADVHAKLKKEALNPYAHLEALDESSEKSSECSNSSDERRQKNPPKFKSFFQDSDDDDDESDSDSDDGPFLKDVFNHLMGIKKVNKKDSSSSSTAAGNNLPKSNLKVEDKSWDDTPLIFLLKSYDELPNGFERVKLLVDAGSDINFKNKVGRTAFMCAIATYGTSKSPDIKLIKYLLDHGATLELQDIRGYTVFDELMISLFENNELTDTEKVKLFKKHHIPLYNLLIESAGNSLWYSRVTELLKYAFEKFTDTIYIQEVILYLIQVTCEKLKEDKSYIIHPLHIIFNNLKVIQKNDKFFQQITNIILYHPSNEFKHFPKHITINIVNSGYKWKCLGFDKQTEIKVSVVGSFVAELPLKDIKNWLMKFKQEKFDFVNDYPLLNILLLRFIQSKTNNTELLETIDYLLEIDYPICSNELHFYGGALDTLQTVYKIPDCLWISAVYGNVDLLKKFLPYWNQHPLSLILFMLPMLETEEKLIELMMKSIKKISTYLYDIGGPYPNDKISFWLMVAYMKELQNIDPELKDHSILDLPRENFKKNLMFKREYSDLFFHLYGKTTPYGLPTSLKITCRTVVRVNAVGHGNNLPNYLASLVPDNDLKLKDFITLRST